MTGRFVIGVDIDDVIFPWYHRAHELCVEADLGLASEVIPTTWSPHEEYMVTLEEWADVLGAGTLTNQLHTGDPIPGAIEALYEFHNIGAEIHLITARGFMQHGEHIRVLTADWLSDWKVPHSTLTFTKKKVPVAKDFGVTHFIDDNVGNIEAMTLHGDGIRTYLQDRPWNQSPGFPVRRVKTMTEFTDAVLHNATPWLEKEKV